MPSPKPVIQQTHANGVDFAYLAEGKGPLLLCLHGFPDTAWSFAPLLPHFAQAGFRAVAPFMRGYAPSGLAPDGNYRVTALAADAAGLVEALGEREAFLLGHDWGAATAYTVATLHPQRFPAVVTAAVPHLRRFIFRPSLRQLQRSRYMAYFQLRSHPERKIIADDFAWLRALIRQWSPGWNFSAQDFEPLRAGFSDPDRLRAALAYYRALPGALMSRENLRLLRRPLPVPALVINGSHDGCIGPEMFQGQEDCFAASYEQLTMQDCGHFMHCEQPQAFADAVIGFLQRQRGRSSS